MNLIYQSDSYIVVHFAYPGRVEPAGDAGTAGTAGTAGAAQGPTLARTGYEIVDKAGQREIYVEGLLAERFAEGVQQIAAGGSPSVEAFDEFIAGWAALAQHRLALH
jgi:hypothetical protein